MLYAAEKNGASSPTCLDAHVSCGQFGWRRGSLEPCGDLDFISLHKVRRRMPEHMPDELQSCLFIREPFHRSQIEQALQAPGSFTLKSVLAQVHE